MNVRDIRGMVRFYQEVLGAPIHTEARRAPETDEDDAPTIVFLTIGTPDTPLARGGHPQMLALLDVRRHLFSLDLFDGHERSKSTLNPLAFEIPPDRHETERERLTAMGLDVVIAAAAQEARAEEDGGVTIIPFANISGNAEDAWFGAGIAETLAASLQGAGVTILRCQERQEPDRKACGPSRRMRRLRLGRPRRRTSHKLPARPRPGFRRSPRQIRRLPLRAMGSRGSPFPRRSSRLPRC